MTREEIAAAKAAKARYMKEYQRRRRQKNPEDAREADLMYWLRRARREAAGAERDRKGGEGNDRDQTASREAN